jgi:2,5-diketo-D-gluconate reductase A
MEKLQTSYLDLLLIHQPFGDYYGTYRAMKELYKAGKLRAIGVSNFGPDRYLDIQHFATVKPAVNQIETHVFQQQKVAREYLQKYNCQPESCGPFAEGRNDIFTNPVLTKIGEKYGKTAAHFCTRADVLHNLSLRGVRIFAGLLFLFLIPLSISAPEFLFR